jgi:hypothetical protein
MSIIALGAGGTVTFEINTDIAAITTSPSGSRHIEYVEGERPADQREWTDADLQTLRRDREQAQNVRDLYMLSNPGEFSNIFTDDVEEGEERITPSNLLNGRAEADADLYDDSNLEQEAERDSRWHAEVIEMHQSGNYNDDPDIDREPNQQIVLDYDSDDDEETLARREREHLNSVTRTIPGVDDNFYEDEDEEEDPREPFNFAEYPHGSLAATLVAQIHEYCEGMSEEQREEFEEDIDNRCLATLQNDFLPRWQAETLADLVVELRNAGVMREEHQQEQEARNEARVRAQELEAQLPNGQPRFEELCAEYQRTEAQLAGNDPDGFRNWRLFRDAACRVANAPVRRCDIFNWYPWLPADFRECLEAMGNFQREVARVRWQVKELRSQAEGETRDVDPFNEEEWAGSMQVVGQPFGFESGHSRVNDFGNFQPPATDMPVAEQVSLIDDANTLRAARVTLAAQRIRQGPAVPSDSHVGGQYLHWLGRARRYLTEFQTRADGSTGMSEDDQYAVLELFTLLGEMEAGMQREPEQAEVQNVEQASGGASVLQTQ